MNLTKYIIAFTLVIAAAGTTAIGVGKYKDNYYHALIDKEKAESAISLAEANLKTLELERRYQEISQSLELKHVESKKQLDAIYADNKRLARQLGGLRDPGKSESCASSLPSTSNSSGVTTEKFQGARLSEAATEFLLVLTREADEAASERNLCQDWLQNTRAL